MDPGPARRLVIFDCDGVLVDTEMIVARAFFTELGPPTGSLAVEQLATMISGRAMGDAIDLVERAIGRRLPSDFVQRLRLRSAAAFREELRAMDGIEALLDALATPYCVASNGPREKMDLTLSITGLASRFRGRMFSAYDIRVWKPDPGLFLHAAREMGIAPAACTVIEDSLPGVLAAQNAGMRVIGFAPGTSSGFAVEGACPPGVRVFRTTAALRDELCSPG